MQNLERRFDSISVKAVVITILTVLMLWPLSRVESLISERQNLQHEAYAAIAAGFGGPQVVGGADSKRGNDAADCQRGLVDQGEHGLVDGRSHPTPHAR